MGTEWPFEEQKSEFERRFLESLDVASKKLRDELKAQLSS
jgi:hypothetical protein